MIAVSGLEKGWKIEGFRYFYEMTKAWVEEIQTAYCRTFVLEYWVSNERFPVVRFIVNGTLVVELFYYPQKQTAACLSGKARHKTQEKLVHETNLLMAYLPEGFFATLQPAVVSEP